MQIHKKGFFFKVLQKGCKQAKAKQSKAKQLIWCPKGGSLP